MNQSFPTRRSSDLPVENIHRNHILWRSYAPARIEPALAAEAERIARELAEGLDYVGVLAVELFDCGDHVLVNEMARSEENTSELQSLMRISYAVFCLKTKT